MSLKFNLFNCLVQRVLNCDKPVVKQEYHKAVIAPIFNVYVHNIAGFLLHGIRLATAKTRQNVVNQ